ncbi:MAG: hypothetical protein IPL78_28425 [Chloroflexi bacterium]|nr:hypothetical protein [Chloroflexota bacterium]
MSALNISHPALHWEQDAHQLHEAPKLRLRLAAMAGHMRLDKIAARRAALIDLLADGRPHPREEIWASVSAQLEADCWGKRPHEALAHDLDVLRQGGLRIGYSRRPQTVGYYLQYPPCVVLFNPGLRRLTGPGSSISASYRGPRKTRLPSLRPIWPCGRNGCSWQKSILIGQPPGRTRSPSSGFGVTQPE